MHKKKGQSGFFFPGSKNYPNKLHKNFKKLTHYFGTNIWGKYSDLLPKNYKQNCLYFGQVMADFTRLFKAK